MADLPADADVVIVGSGPAGLAAAAELCRLGLRAVHVLERADALGGVPRHCGHSPYGLREFGRPMFGPAYARALVAKAGRAGAVLHTGVTVTALGPGPTLSVSSDAGIATLSARAVLLATGTRETPRTARLIGGQKPGGVMVTGALQSMVYGPGKRPFRRPVILGSELVSFSAILTCRHAGIRPVAMVEPGQRITARHPAQLLPRILGIPLHLNAEIAEIAGRDRVEAVEISGPSGMTRIAADGVIVTGQFRPEATLVRASELALDPRTGGPEVDEGGRCSQTGVYAAGNVLRPVETAGWCWQEGRSVALCIAQDLQGLAPLDSVPIAVSGALKYAVPQRISDASGRGFGQIQLRVPHAVSGRLSLRVDGHEIAGRPLSALPERRLLLPLPAPQGRLEVALDEH